jgi:hypothetical protein
MPDPNRLLRTLRQAIQAFRATPGRDGRLVRLKDVQEVLVAGDLHGNIENFRQLLGRAKLTHNPGRHLVLQELIHGSGRYPDGGDKSHQLVDLLAALKCEFPGQVHLLLGNHELAQWLGHEIAKKDDSLCTLFRSGVATAYGASADAVYAAYLDLFAVVPLALRTPNRIFLSHSVPSAKRLESFDPEVLTREELPPAELHWGGGLHALLWGRDSRPETVAEFLRKVDADLIVTGHIPAPNGFEAPNDRQLILDSQGMSACYCLFPTDRPLLHADLLGFVQRLRKEQVRASVPADLS